MAAEAGHKKMAEFLYLNTQFGCLDRGERIRLFFITLTCDLYDFKGFCKQGSKLESAHEVLAMIWKKVLKRSDEEISDLIRRPSGVLFDAAMSGNIEFLALLLRNYPDLLWEVNEKGQTIFHVAVLHRHVEVFNLIKNIGAAKEYIVGYIDADKNDMLHLAGMLPQVERLGAPRANLQMQRELLWFKVDVWAHNTVYLHNNHGLGLYRCHLFDL
ncbi:hypothetical protein SO802_029649 [Lithocarpus litseifolius]|uniref:Uncharacterized protein n=1 Tax=Lithocarpus litseifolius TaxID=425828 RepID=A0AAW2BWY9_9ROSI